MTSLFHKYETDFPDLCKVYSIGTSVQGRELWVLQITQGVNDIPKLRIRFKPENGLEKLGTLKKPRFSDQNYIKNCSEIGGENRIKDRV